MSTGAPRGCTGVYDGRTVRPMCRSCARFAERPETWGRGLPLIPVTSPSLQPNHAVTCFSREPIAA